MSISQSLINSFIVAVFLTGCSSVNTTTVPTSTIVSLTPSLSNSIKNPTPVKNSPLLTATPRPSATPDLTETAFAQEKNSTQIAEQTLVAQFPQTCEYDLYFSREFSTDKLWMIETCYSEADKSPVMTISNKETQTIWKLLYADYLPNPDILPDGGLSAAHWSNDGRYMYFSSYMSGSGGECFVGIRSNEDGKGLFRLDLQTGDITTVLPLRGSFGGYGFSFSPTDRRLVYETYSLGLSILDLQTGHLINVYSSNADSIGGDYVWSPDGIQFVYSTVETTNNWETRIYTLRLVNALSGNEQILFESPDICFATKLWSENDVLTIESYDENYDRTIIDFDLNSNEIISEVTATPFP